MHSSYHAAPPTSSLTSLFPLHFSFLTNIPASFIAPLLAFNFAVWQFRKPAQASRLVQDRLWLINKIVESARLNLLSIKAPKRKLKNNLAAQISINDHSDLLSTAGADTAIAYTDGSASPNPGPSGGGVSIFIQNPDMVIDCGVTLGSGTNNSAELFALGVCFAQLLRIRSSHRALIFSDSQLAISAATSSRKPLSNSILVHELRKTYAALLITKLTIELVWVPGHAGVGGNERVDRISKAFATDANKFNSRLLAGFPSCVSQRAWPFFPLNSAPLGEFTAKVHCPPFLDVVTAAVDIDLTLPAGHLKPFCTKRVSSVTPSSHSMRLRKSHSITVTDVLPEVSSGGGLRTPGKIRRTNMVGTGEGLFGSFDPGVCEGDVSRGDASPQPPANLREDVLSPTIIFSSTDVVNSPPIPIFNAVPASDSDGCDHKHSDD